MKARIGRQFGKVRKLWRRAKYYYCRFMIARHQAEIDAITQQRALDDQVAEFLQGRIERRQHKARALREQT